MKTRMQRAEALGLRIAKRIRGNRHAQNIVRDVMEQWRNSSVEGTYVEHEECEACELFESCEVCAFKNCACIVRILLRPLKMIAIESTYVKSDRSDPDELHEFRDAVIHMMETALHACEENGDER